MPQDLKLHLPLNEVRDGLVHDISGNDLHGMVKGDAITEHDQTIGTCLTFDGVDDYIELPNLSFDATKGITIEAFVRFDARADNGLINWWMRIFDMNVMLVKDGNGYNQAVDKVVFLGNYKGNKEIIFYAMGVGLQLPDAFETDTWAHVGVCISPKGFSRLYIDGILLREVKFDPKQYAPAGTTGLWNHFFIGKSSYAWDGAFLGRMAHVRIYERALASEEIIRDMQLDRVANQAFRSTQPLEFDLYSIADDDHRPVLYIEKKGLGNPLELTATNNSGKTLELIPSELAPDNDTFHFQLRFRQKTLSDHFIQNGLDAALQAFQAGTMLGGVSNGDWDYHHGHDLEDRSYVISFLYKGAEALSFEMNSVLRIRIPGVNAAQGGGHRGTRVEVRYDRLQPAGASLPLKGSRTRHLEIISHLGLKTTPLIAGVHGSNTLLNDSVTAQNLKLFLRNFSNDKDIEFLTQAEAEDAATRFVLAFDPQWFRIYRASTNDDNVTPNVNQVSGGGITVTAGLSFEDQDQDGIPDAVDSDPTDARIPGTGEVPNIGMLEGLAHTGSHEYIFVSTSLQKLAPGEEIVFDISGLKSSQEDGVVNLYIYYWNLPGYQDGAFVVPVQIQPLVIRGDKVGIGVNPPQAELHVGGDIKADGNFNAGADIAAAGNLRAGQKVFDANGEVVPRGVILMWSGSTASIPRGWRICDGGGGTPDLRNRFIIGAGSSYNPGSTGGSDTIRLDVKHLPSHSHAASTVYSGEHTHYYYDIYRKTESSSGGGLAQQASEQHENVKRETERAGHHNHTVIVQNTGGGQGYSFLPRYYALCFIMKM